MYTIENNYLKVSITTKGGSLTSIYDKRLNKELLYQPIEGSWQSQDIVIFPFIAKIKNDTYTIDNKPYVMQKHGLLRYRELNLINKTKDSITLGKVSDNDTLKEYPYKFDFKVNYTLINNTLKLTYTVRNIDSKSIYYSLGGHPAYQIKGKLINNIYEFDNAYITFNKKINLNRYVLNEDGSLITGIENIGYKDRIDITKSLLKKVKTLILDATEIDYVELHNDNDVIKFNINNAKTLAIWTMYDNGNYICVEPWWGIPDYENPILELKDKPLIEELEQSSTKEYYFETSY